MTDLFDLPFEDDDAVEPSRAVEPQPIDDRRRPARDRRRPRPDGRRLAADAGRDARRVLTVTELTVRVRDLLEDRVLRGLGRRRAVELPRLEHRPSVLHAEGRLGADPRRHLPLGAALSEVQAGGRPARRRARTRLGVRAEGRVSARLRAPRAAGARRAAARVRSAEEAARRPKGCSTPRASGRCRRCRARSASSRRSTARRSATSSRCCGRRYANAHLVIRPARVQGEGAALEIARGAARDRRACRASTSSSSGAAAGRSKISGRSTKRSSRARSRGRRCR